MTATVAIASLATTVSALLIWLIRYVAWTTTMLKKESSGAPNSR